MAQLLDLLQFFKEVFEFVRDTCKELDLELNEKKCQLWWETMDLDKLKVSPSELERVKESGIRVLGGFTADSVEAVDEYACSIVDKIMKPMTLARQLRDPLMELVLLRSCLGMPKFQHVLRTNHPDSIKTAIRIFDQGIDSSLCHIFGEPYTSGLSPRVRDICSLPLAMGGFDIPLAADYAFPAFINARIQYVNELPSNEQALEELTALIESWRESALPVTTTLTVEAILVSDKPLRS